MVKEVQDWSTTDASNNFDPSEGGMPENQNRTTVNNAARARMGAIRRWYDDPEWLDLVEDATVEKLSDQVLRIVNFDATSYAEAGRRIKIQTAGTPPTNVLETFVVSSVLNVADTEITITATDTIAAGVDEVFFYFGASLRALAFQATQASLNFYVPSALTSAALQTSIDDANTAGGGIVLLDQGTYAIASTVTLKDKVSIWGRGREVTILRQDNSTDLDAVLTGNAIDQVHLMGFTIDGNRANQTGGDGRGIEIEATGVPGNTDVTLEGLHVKDTYREGIFFQEPVLGANSTNAITRCSVVDPGSSGICVLSGPNANTRFTVSDCSVDSPGQDATVLDFAGFRLAGSLACTGLSVNKLTGTGAQVPIGIELEDVAAAEPSTRAAKDLSLSSFSIVGSGASAIGLLVQGVHSAVTAGAIDLSGAGSTGLKFDAPTSGQKCIENVVGDLTISATTGVNIPADCEENVLSGCAIIECTTGMSIAGVKNSINGNTIIAGGITGDGIQVAATANETSIIGNTIRDCTSEGIDITSGAANTAITSNVIEGCSGSGILINSGVTSTRVYNNTLANNSTNLSDNSGALKHGYNSGVVYSALHVETGTRSFDGAEGDFNQLTAIPFPGVGADGSRKFIVFITINANTTSAGSTLENLLCKLYMGPNGNKSDTVVWNGAQSATHEGEWTLSLGPMELTPATGDKLGLSAQRSGATVNAITLADVCTMRIEMVDE